MFMGVVVLMTMLMKVMAIVRTGFHAVSRARRDRLDGDDNAAFWRMGHGRC